MDGTLVDSEELAFLSAHEGLREFYAVRGLSPLLPNREELRRWVGLPSLEYFAQLVPPQFRGEAIEVRERVARHEIERLSVGKGRLFPGVRATLDTLRREGWKLGLVSNCGRPYLKANLEHLGLGEFFETALCLDDHPPKSENVRRALEKLGCERGVMVGDRSGDVEAGRANGLRTVGCTYGFGTPEELATADARIPAFAELPLLIFHPGFRMISAPCIGP